MTDPDSPASVRKQSAIISAWRTRPELTYWILLMLLSLLGLLLRLIDLGKLPSGLYRDEAMNALDGFAAVSSGALPLYYPDNYGRGLFQEGLFLNLQGLTSLVFGPSIFAARLPAAVIGAAGILGVAFMARQLFLSRTLALLAAGLLTFSYWGINFSRIGFSAILVPTVLATAVGLIVWAGRHGSNLRVLAAGAFFGLGIYTYAAYRFSPVLALIVIAAMAWGLQWSFARSIRFTVVLGAGALATSLPFLTAIYREPRIFSARSQDVSLLSADLPMAELIERLLMNSSLAAGKFLFLGDLNIRHNYGPYGILSPFVAILMLTGIVMCAIWIFRGVQANWTGCACGGYVLGSVILLGGLVVMTSPEVLSADTTPHSLRSIGSQPFTMTFAAIPLWRFAQWTKSAVLTHSRRVRLVAVGLASVLAVSLLFDIFRYFVMFRNSEEQRIAFDADLPTMIETANQSGSGVVLLPYPQQEAVLTYLTDRGSDHLRVVKDVNQINIGDTIWIRLSDEDLTQEVLKAFPDSAVSVVQESGAGSEFISITTL